MKISEHENLKFSELYRFYNVDEFDRNFRFVNNSTKSEIYFIEKWSDIHHIKEVKILDERLPDFITFQLKILSLKLWNLIGKFLVLHRQIFKIYV